MVTHLHWLRVAIHICASRKELAKRARIKKGRITEWLNETRKINLENAFKIEMATAGKVLALDLMSCLSPQLRTYLSRRLSVTQFQILTLTLREKVELGLAYEKACQSSSSQKTGHSTSENFHKSAKKITGPAVETSHSKKLTRLDPRAADYAGFGNYRTYRDAKVIVERGTPLLIAAVDSKQISIYRATQLVKQPQEQWQQAVQLMGNKKALIAHLNTEAKKPVRKPLLRESNVNSPAFDRSDVLTPTITTGEISYE